MDRPISLPTWLRELDGSLAVNSQFVLWGNVHDLYLIPGGSGPTMVDMESAIWSVLADEYDAMVVFDPIVGVHTVPADLPDDSPVRTRLNVLLQAIPSVSDSFGTSQPDSTAAQPDERVRGGQPRPDQLVDLIGALTGQDLSPAAPRVVTLVPYASRLVVDPTRLTVAEHRLFASLYRLSHASTVRFREGHRSVHNSVIWLADGERDLPLWFTAQNEAVRPIPVPRPDLGRRALAAAVLAPALPDADPDRFPSRFADLTADMTLTGIWQTVRLATDQQIAAADIDDAVRRYRLGISDNPWKEPDRLRRIADGQSEITKRVLGQDDAVAKAIDILKRSAVDMTAAASSGGSGSRPRGVLFLAGPTGVGKTELAKALTELVFGSEDQMLRFDMSEYNTAHSEARLIGSPPGYVGFDAGGQLTGAVREKPLSLILFDEIEKADVSILDKFLQILDDARLTDGAGQTVFFTESIIVFTSNLGIRDRDGKIVLTHEAGLEAGKEAVRQAIVEAVEQFFASIDRPEIFNRLGQNIVVLGFIDRDLGKKILEQKVANIVEWTATEHRVELDLGGVMGRLEDLALSNLQYGGRSIVKLLEVALIDPLSRLLFEQLTGRSTVERIVVTDIEEEGSGRFRLVTT